MKALVAVHTPFDNSLSRGNNMALASRSGTFGRQDPRSYRLQFPFWFASVGSFIVFQVGVSTLRKLTLFGRSSWYLSTHDSRKLDMSYSRHRTLLRPFWPVRGELLPVMDGEVPSLAILSPRAEAGGALEFGRATIGMGHANGSDSGADGSKVLSVYT